MLSDREHPAPRLLDEGADLGETAWLLEWCRRYHADPRHYRSPLQRFCVGAYQVWQHYKDATGGHGKLAALAIHVLVAAEATGCDCDQYLPDYLASIPSQPWDPEKMLKLICELTQQHCYMTWMRPGTARAGRVDKRNVAHKTAEVVLMALGQMRESERMEALENEIERLEATEWARK